MTIDNKKILKFFKKGNGELMGFLIVAPSIIIAISIIISIVQVSLVNQKLTTAAYNCGRAAAVSETQDIGEQRAEELYEELVGDVINSYGYTACEVEVLDGETWKKGSYIKCTVRTYLDVLMPFSSGVREQSIVMMIEGGNI